MSKGSSLNRKETIKDGSLQHWEGRKVTENMGNAKGFPFEFSKLCLTVE